MEGGPTTEHNFCIESHRCKKWIYSELWVKKLITIAKIHTRLFNDSKKIIEAEKC